MVPGKCRDVEAWIMNIFCMKALLVLNNHWRNSYFRKSGSSSSGYIFLYSSRTYSQHFSFHFHPIYLCWWLPDETKWLEGEHRRQTCKAWSARCSLCHIWRKRQLFWPFSFWSEARWFFCHYPISRWSPSQRCRRHWARVVGAFTVGQAVGASDDHIMRVCYNL